MILTKAAPKIHAIKNYVLNELLCEIHKLAMCFDEIEFTQVPWELNKQADAIATAVSWSKEDRTCAVIDHHWDPRSQHIAETSEEWIILNSTLWNWITSPLTCDWTFPISPGNVVRKFQRNMVTTPHVLFLVQTAHENALILLIIITKDIFFLKVLLRSCRFLVLSIWSHSHIHHCCSVCSLFSPLFFLFSLCFPPFVFSCSFPSFPAFCDVDFCFVLLQLSLISHWFVFLFVFFLLLICLVFSLFPSDVTFICSPFCVSCYQ